MYMHIKHSFASILSNGGACDSHGGKMILHKDVRLILHDLESIGIPIAAASRYVSFMYHI